MSLKTPVGRFIHTWCVKCAKAKLAFTLSNVFNNLLEALKVGDFVCTVTSFFKKFFVVDNTVALNYVSDTFNLAVVTFKLKCIVGAVFNDF